MSKLTKNRKLALEKLDKDKLYTIGEAAEVVKEMTSAKFDESIDIDISLGVDPRKANQMVRGVVTLPHGTGKDVKVLVLCTPEKEDEAKEAVADYVGLDYYIEKITGGWTGYWNIQDRRHSRVTADRWLGGSDRIRVTSLPRSTPWCSGGHDFNGAGDSARG